MSDRPGLTYAPIFAGLMLLWPIAAYSGAQGFTIIIAIASFPAWYFARPKSLPPYLIAFAAFIVWAIATSAWSPASGPLVDGSLAGGNFSVNATAIRVGLTAFGIAGVVMGAANIPIGNHGRSAGLLRSIPAVQGIGVLVTSLAMGMILSWLAPISDPVSNMPQNLMRNVNAYVILLPVLFAWLWTRPSFGWRAAAGLILAGSVFAALKTGSESAFFALIFIAIGTAIAHFFPKNGLRTLLYTLCAYILTAPAVMLGLGAVARASNLPLPLSFWSRIHSWQRVSEEVMANPIFGAGIEASETWRELYKDRPDLWASIAAETGKPAIWENYTIVPGHPHSMGLQIWAETGLIGAVLAASAVFLLARRLGNAETWEASARFASVALIMVTMTFFAVSYSVWNEAFWCSIALSAASIIVLARHRTAP